MGGPRILPAWVDVLWVVALAAVLVVQGVGLARTDRQHRSLHLAHAVMIVGMISMYVANLSGRMWVPAGAWTRLHALVAAAIILWMVVCGARERPFSFLWWPALVQQVAMVYMWTAPGDWLAWLTYALAGYFGAEALAWLLSSPRERAAVSTETGGPGPRLAVMPGRAAAPIGKVGMATMAASMSYMFVGMQLLR